MLKSPAYFETKRMTTGTIESAIFLTTRIPYSSTVNRYLIVYCSASIHDILDP